MRLHEQPLVRYAARLTGNVELARDVVQETFLRLLSASPAPADGHLGQWLFTVCRNGALDALRKERRMTTLDNIQAEPHSAALAPPAQAQLREDLGQLLAAVATLPANQQEVIRLKFQNGLAYRQIAGITGLSESNVGFLIHTAIKAIRAKLSPARGQGALP